MELGINSYRQRGTDILKKLYFRFIAYFTTGLFIFLVYFITLFILLNQLIYPEDSHKFLYVIDSSIIYFPNTLIFTFCFITGGILFCLFLVRPLYLIISSISNLSRGNYTISKKAFTKNGKLKWYNFMYREVIINIKDLGNKLQETEIEREKLEVAKTDWLASVSHDLKTPLSYITGYSSLMLNKNHSFSEEERLTFLNNIYTKGIYIEKLIDELSLTFFIDSHNKIHLKHTQVEIVSFLRNLIADITNNPKSEKHIFEFHTDLQHLNLVIDETLMYRAIYNLLINCVEHNPSGTEIDVVLTQKSDEIYININDNGIGINPETLNDIFAKYYSSKNQNTQNKGLGLFIVKQIIDAHEGNISVSSIMGKGTSFQIMLKQHKP
ncbi:sensory transduction histidine kinase [Clostridioides difficile]|nr:sensory transduction histidine kinase [Clostridioides difficile]VFF94451.1 sensory transduction histidine kinase [Clostridioides difficile]VHX85699.1 sensory transduction histidine kinase [Clostridioides difficile]VIG05530.1 sensory transduction histidine kinase [Clostridioides difficile]VIG09629.1 sensory transduction histidine kinase [Clostridioides difficile]